MSIHTFSYSYNCSTYDVQYSSSRHLGHQKSITCEFSVNSCDWITDFHVQNSQAVSPVADYNTNSLNTGILANMFVSCIHATC